MRLAIGFNPVISASEMAAVATRAEQAGFESLWMHESLFQRDVVTYIAAMVGTTHRIKLGSGIINTFTRHPVVAASTFATFSELSNGRVVFGLGLGSFPTIPLIGHQIFPVEKTRPLRRVMEYLEVVRQVWKGGKVDYDGEFFHVHNLTLGFPVKSPIPVFIASLSPKTQEYAATVADGVILSPALSTSLGTEAMIGNVKRGENRRGKNVERASYIMTSVDSDPEMAVDSIRGYYFFLYQLAEVVKPQSLEPYDVKQDQLDALKAAWTKGDIALARKLVPESAINALAAVGRPDQVKDKLKEYVKAGVTLPIMMPIGNVDYAISSLAPS